MDTWNTYRNVVAVVCIVMLTETYQCTDCPKAFTQGSELTVHIRRAHTGEKPYACDVCEYSYAASGDLARHKRNKAHMQAVAAVQDASSHAGVCACFDNVFGCLLAGL